MAIKLITGLKTTADIESGDDGARIYGTVSSSDRVLNVGSCWEYQIISSNLVRIKDGELLMQGRHARQAPNTYTDLTINNGTQNLFRNDLIVARYTKNSSTGIENVELAVLQGTPGSTATDPTITTGNIFEGCEIHEMALYRVSLNGLNIESVTQMFKTLVAVDNIVNLIYPVGSIYMSVNSTNPSTFFGGTWVSWGTGKVAVGVDISDTNFNMVEKTGGSKNLQAHTHNIVLSNITYASGGNYNAFCMNSAAVSDIKTTYSTGEGNSQNLQPYITCYMWKRIQ